MNPAHGDGGTCYGDSGGPNFLGAGATETNIVAAHHHHRRLHVPRDQRGLPARHGVGPVVPRAVRHAAVGSRSYSKAAASACLPPLRIGTPCETSTRSTGRSRSGRSVLRSSSCVPFPNQRSGQRRSGSKSDAALHRRPGAHRPRPERAGRAASRRPPPPWPFERRGFRQEARHLHGTRRSPRSLCFRAVGSSGPTPRRASRRRDPRCVHASRR